MSGYKFVQEILGPHPEDLLNSGRPPLRISHAELPRLTRDSAYRSKCPECKTGILLMLRDRTTFKLCRNDMCRCCGQAYIYTDRTVNGETLHSVASEES